MLMHENVDALLMQVILSLNANIPSFRTSFPVSAMQWHCLALSDCAATNGVWMFLATSTG